MTLLRVGTCTVIASQPGGFGYEAAVSVTQSFTVGQKGLTVSGLTALNKVYDGSTAAQLTGVATLNGVIAGDVVNVSGTAAGAFDTATAGTGKTVTISGLTLVGGQATNYILTTPITTSGTITRASPAIVWATPTNIAVGTPLSATQLNATANTAGNFTYNPIAGTVLAVGTHTLNTVFNPADNVNYADGSAAVSLVVSAAAATISVNFRGNGAGRVRSIPVGLDCTADCSTSVGVGAQVVLSAAAAPGSLFVGWLGAGCAGRAPTCAIAATSEKRVSATFVPEGTPISLDIDNSGAPTQFDAATDGVMILRLLLGLSGDAITDNARVNMATGRTAKETQDYLALIKPVLDIDGDGSVDALTDGVLIVRYMIGLRGSALINGVLGSQATRSDTAIADYLSGLMP